MSDSPNRAVLGHLSSVGTDAGAAALSRSEARYRALAEASSQAVWGWSPDGSSGDFSATQAWWAELTGQTPEEQSDKTTGWLAVVHPDDREAAGSAWETSLATGRPYDVEYRVTARAGGWRHVRARGVPVRVPDGAILEWVGTLDDVTERRVAEAARREGEERLRLALEASGTGVWEWDIVTGRITWSDQVHAFYGMEPGEFDGTLETFARHLYPDDADRASEAIRASVEGDAPYRIEYRIVPKGGGVRWISTVGRVIRDAAGKPLRMIGATLDVTEQKRMEDARRESEVRFRALFEQAPFSVQLFAPDGRTLGVNRAWEKLWGLTFDQLADYNLFADPQLEIKGIAPYLRRAAAGEAVEIPAIRYDPEETIPGRSRSTDPQRWVSAVAYPLMDPGGRVREVVLVHQDITVRALAEEAIRRNEAWLQTVTDSLPALVGYVGRDLRYRFANRAYEEWFGVRPADVIGRSISEVLGEDDFRFRQERIEAVLSGEAVTFEAPTRHRALGSRVSEVTYTPHREGGAVAGFFVHVHDITARRRGEQERERLVEELREADRKKDDFIALLAHELRNPLAPIRNGLQVVRLSQDRTMRERSQAMMDRQLAHMVRLIDDLLDVSRIGRNKMELRRARVTLAEVVGTAVETAAPAIEEAGHELTISLPPLPIFLNADLTRLAQVFSNLLTNSAKYTLRGGRVWLAAEPVEGSVVVSVRDTGIGIPAESLPAIFDMFSQVDRSIERSTGGLGIGLALVKGLVEMHGGTVTAASGGSGLGSTFTVTLPTVTNRPGVQLPADGGPHTRPVYRILVVDDNRDGAESLSEMLRLLGHEVATAHDGLEAVEVAGEFGPELILMDIGMPRLNGLEATRRIREQPWGKAMTVVALTGWGQENDREKSRAAGCDGHLVKPVNLPDLERVLAEVRTGAL